MHISLPIVLDHRKLPSFSCILSQLSHDHRPNDWRLPLPSLFLTLQDIKNFLSNPTINEEKKKELLKRIASESGFDKYTLNFLNLLVDQGRIEAIQEICDAFETRYCDLTETQVAVLRSAVKLEQEQQFLIAKKLQELTGSKNIKLKPVIDESLIAGFIVEWGSSQIDLSVKGQLDKISGELVSSANLAASS